MRKKRILWVNEASFLSTGYSTYGREVMQRMYDSGKYEVAELGCYSHNDDPRGVTFPWKVYPNFPMTPEEEKIYESDPINVFGKWQFEKVCLDFKPDFVLDIRDFWMWSFEATSPFREFYRHILMPTVDSEPQKPEWLWEISKADAVLTYQDWSLNYLKKFNGMNNLVCSAPSAANEAFIHRAKEEKLELKAKFGVGKDTKIIGTIMRNQMRKLYPQLFQDFRTYLDKTKREDVVLLCHASFPDLNGWNFPELLNEYGIASKVVFTYRCHECGEIKILHYEDIHSVCKTCRKDSYCLPSVHNGVPVEALSMIYSLMDVYVQYSCAEGLGMPQLEAAACGIPIMSTNYSGMQDIVKKVEGYPISYTVSKEISTGCMRAIPNSGDFVNKLINFFNMSDEEREAKEKQTRANFEKHYHSWDKIANIWMKVIDDMDFPEKSWDHPPRYKRVVKDIPKDLTDTEFARFLIKDVWQEPNEVNGFIETDVIEKLTFKIEEKKGFNREKGYNVFAGRVKTWNEWEQERANRI